jgi:hypothetical protein
MAIDFGILRPLAEGVKTGEVARVAPQPSGLDSLAGGLLQGVQAGQQIQNAQVARQSAQLEMQKTQQEMQQSAAMAPSQLQNSQATADFNTAKAQRAQADLVAANAKAAADQKVNEAYQKGGMEGARTAEYTYGGVAAGQAFDTANLAIQKTISDISKANAETDTTVIANSKQLNTQLAGIASQVSQIKDPQTQIKTAGLLLANLPPSAQKAFSMVPVDPQKGYDPQFLHALVARGLQQTQDDANDANAKAAGSKGTVTGTPLSKAQDVMKQRYDELQAAQDSKDPTRIQMAQKNYQQAQDATALTLQPKDPGAANNETAKAISGQDAKEMKAADDAVPALKTLADNGHQILQLLQKVPKGFVGPLQDLSKLNMASSDIQVLQHFFAENGYVAKVALANQTAGMRMTNTELQQLNNIVGGTSKNWDAIKQIVGNINDQATSKAHDNWTVSNRVRAGGNQEDFKRWRDANPEPFNPATADKPSGYMYNGKPVPNAALHQAMLDNPGKSADEVAKMHGLTKGQ